MKVDLKIVTTQEFINAGLKTLFFVEALEVYLLKLEIIKYISYLTSLQEPQQGMLFFLVIDK